MFTAIGLTESVSLQLSQIFKLLLTYRLKISDKQLEDIDLIHYFSISLRCSKPALWSGFMQAGYKGKDHPGVSSFIYLPIIDLPPTDYNCIYSTLIFLKSLADSVNRRPIITFDQPLYLKALQITTCEGSGLEEIILKLGSFHTAMIFLCAIGDTMANSGFQEAIEILYAENSTNSILKGTYEFFYSLTS